MKTLDLSKIRTEFEAALDDHILNLEVPIGMLKPMIYSLKGGGKRLRPLLLLATLDVYGHQLMEYGMSTAMALEYIHTYSLIHDDLPAMDNDDLRRGNPTNHVQFSEAIAILAGDALLTDAFALIGNDTQLKPKQKVLLMTQLSQAAGSVGMVAGQLRDIEGSSQSVTISELEQVHALKTGCLFNYSLKAAAIILNLGNKEQQLLEKFGNAFGVAYQIHNDLLDVIGDPLKNGKEMHGDLKLDRATYPSVIGVDESKKALKSEVKKAMMALKRLSKYTDQPFNQLEAFLAYVNIDKFEEK